MQDHLLGLLKEYHPETYRHSVRVAELSLKIAKEMSFEPEHLDLIYDGALHHDIGKLKIARDILSKPSKLTKQEWLQIQEHPIHGYQLLKGNSPNCGFSHIALLHHERVDGSGYPFGLKREQIPVDSMIVAVADSYDVMTHLRSYQKPIPQEEAIREITDQNGVLYDPDVVKAFVNVMERERK
ncbi:MAG: HD domain-containing protein [Bacillaceae bacterium]|nr:HD domain-containing protein [Bacillaceae bacterium]